MSDYPVILKLKDRLCVVIGGGPVAIRKARGLLQAGARVRMVAETVAQPAELAGAEVVIRAYRDGDLQGAFLAFAATDNRSVNAAIVQEARERGILVSVADAPDEGDFTLPALLRRGDLSVAVASSGMSPGLAILLRDRLDNQIGPEWGAVLEIAAALRRNRLTLTEKAEYNQAILRRLLESGLPEMVAGGDAPAVDRLLQSLFGEGCSLAKLGIRLEKGTT